MEGLRSAVLTGVWYPPPDSHPKQYPVLSTVNGMAPEGKSKGPDKQPSILMTEDKGILRRTKSMEDHREKRIPDGGEWATDTKRTSY